MHNSQCVTEGVISNLKLNKIKQKTNVLIVLWWPSAAIVNFHFENDTLFEKRNTNIFQNFTSEMIKWTKTAKQFLFYFHNFNFGF